MVIQVCVGVYLLHDPVIIEAGVQTQMDTGQTTQPGTRVHTPTNPVNVAKMVAFVPALVVSAVCTWIRNISAAKQRV